MTGSDYQRLAMRTNDGESSLRLVDKIAKSGHEDYDDTGVHIEVPYGCVAMVKSKSGLMCNKGITTDGTVDCGYSGSIRVCLFNHSGEHHIFEKGDKIAQLVIMLLLNPEIELHQVAQVEARERGINGFGSTGK